MSNDSKCEHEWQINGLRREVVETGIANDLLWEKWSDVCVLICTKCFCHKTVESKPIE